MRALRLTSLTTYVNPARAFSTTRQEHANILFALHALSNSRETQHFNRISRLDRVEHSPPLQLIKASEVDAFPIPAPLSQSAITTPLRKTREPSRSVLDDKALRIGKLILSEHARNLSRSQRALDSVKRQNAQAKDIGERERADWAKDKARLQRELRSAGGLIIAAVATATVLATWRFWPQGTSFSRAKVLDAKPVGSTGTTASVMDTQRPSDVVLAVPPSTTTLPIRRAAPAPVPEGIEVGPAAPSQSWRSMLWKLS